MEHIIEKFISVIVYDKSEVANINKIELYKRNLFFKIKKTPEEVNPFTWFEDAVTAAFDYLVRPVIHESYFAFSCAVIGNSRRFGFATPNKFENITYNDFWKAIDGMLPRTIPVEELSNCIFSFKITYGLNTNE